MTNSTEKTALQEFFQTVAKNGILTVFPTEKTDLLMTILADFRNGANTDISTERMALQEFGITEQRNGI